MEEARRREWQEQEIEQEYEEQTRLKGEREGATRTGGD